jgi:vacuolar-type H+-ATPase subunit B/Vma2
LNLKRNVSVLLAAEDNDELHRSFRQLLPSESHLKKSKQQKSKECKDQSFLFNDLSIGSLSQFESQTLVAEMNPPLPPRLSFEDDSFKKFTDEIVKKYMQEEEIRSKHQVE